jgi:hypothetical protein
MKFKRRYRSAGINICFAFRNSVDPREVCFVSSPEIKILTVDCTSEFPNVVFKYVVRIRQAFGFLRKFVTQFSHKTFLPDCKQKPANFIV